MKFLFLFLLSWLLPLSEVQAEDCQAPNKCASGAAINAAAEALCHRARASELKIPKLIQDKADLELRESFCQGALAQEIARKPEPEAKMPRWFLVTLDISAVILTGTGAALIASGAPPEVGAVIGGLGLGAGALRIVFEF